MIAQYAKDETMWEVIIQKSVQKSQEDPTTYGDKIIRLCRKQNHNMTDKAIATKVLNGLIEEQRVSIMNLDNSTIEKLKRNLKTIKKNQEKFGNGGTSKMLSEIKVIKESLKELAGGKNDKK